MLNGSAASSGLRRPSASRSCRRDAQLAARHSGRGTARSSVGAKRSKPAATAVWVVNRLPARVAASATSKRLPAVRHEARGPAPAPRTRHALRSGGRPPVACPASRAAASRRCPGSAPAAGAAPGPPPYSSLVMPRSAGKLAGVVAVEQVQLDPTDLHLPGAQPDRVTRQGDLQPQPFAVGFAQGGDRQLPGVVVGIERLLRPVRRSPGGSSLAGRAVRRRPPAPPGRSRP